MVFSMVKIKNSFSFGATKKKLASVTFYSFFVLAALFSIFFMLHILATKTANQGQSSLEREEINNRLKGPLAANDSTVITFLRNKYLYPPSNKSYNLDTSAFYNDASKLTWTFIHDKLEKLFKNEPPGFFVESGALDGQLLSNTLFLEKEKGWKGLLIEPEPTNFKTLLKKNRKSWAAGPCCISRFSYPIQNTLVGYNPPVRNGLQRDLMHWFVRSVSYEFKYGLDPSIDVPPIFNQVHCFPLETFLHALNVSVVDFLSLDIQGGEWDVLRHFPFDKIKVRTMVIEYLVANDSNELSPEFIKYMEDIGYALIGTSYQPDYFFVKKNDPLLKNVL